MATFVKTPAGTCKGIIRKRGWPTTIKTFRTKRDATDWARRAEDEMVRGVYISLTHGCKAGLTPGPVSLTPAGPRRHHVPRTNRSNEPADHIGSRSSAANPTSPAGI